MAVEPIPEGYHALSPHLVVDDAAKAIEFYKQAFGATERGRMDTPDGKIAHAEIQIGDSVMMLADQFPQSTTKSPKQVGATTTAIYLYVDDVDAVFQKAVDAGATETMAVQDMFWGDRYGQVTDPFGHEWQIATHKEDLTPEEVAERGKEMMAQMG
jgi:PhnB protein